MSVCDAGVSIVPAERAAGHDKRYVVTVAHRCQIARVASVVVGDKHDECGVPARCQAEFVDKPSDNTVGECERVGFLAGEDGRWYIERLMAA